MATRRFLAPQGRAGNGHGYLTQPARPYPVVADSPDVVEKIATCTSTSDEPEAPSAAWLSATADRAFMLNRQARIAEIAQAQKVRPALSVEQRMLDARRRAKLQHVDMRSEFTAMGRMLDAARTENPRRAERTMTALVRRLEQAEHRLDIPPEGMAA